MAGFIDKKWLVELQLTLYNSRIRSKTLGSSINIAHFIVYYLHINLSYKNGWFYWQNGWFNYNELSITREFEVHVELLISKSLRYTMLKCNEK